MGQGWDVLRDVGVLGGDVSRARSNIPHEARGLYASGEIS